MILSGTGASEGPIWSGSLLKWKNGVRGVSRTKTVMVSGLVDKGALGVHSWLEDACSTGNPEP